VSLLRCRVARNNSYVWYVRYTAVYRPRAYVTHEHKPLEYKPHQPDPPLDGLCDVLVGGVSVWRRSAVVVSQNISAHQPIKPITLISTYSAYTYFLLTDPRSLTTSLNNGCTENDLNSNDARRVDTVAQKVRPRSDRWTPKNTQHPNTQINVHHSCWLKISKILTLVLIYLFICLFVYLFVCLFSSQCQNYTTINKHLVVDNVTIATLMITMKNWI